MLPVYIDDLVAGILAALRRGEPGQAYAVWDGDGVTFAEYFRRLAEATGTSEPMNLPKPLLWAMGGATEARRPAARRAAAVRPPRDPPARPPRHGLERGDPRGARLGARRSSLDEGIRRTAEWLRVRRAIVSA